MWTYWSRKLWYAALELLHLAQLWLGPRADVESAWRLSSFMVHCILCLPWNIGTVIQLWSMQVKATLDPESLENVLQEVSWRVAWLGQWEDLAHEKSLLPSWLMFSVQKPEDSHTSEWVRNVHTFEVFLENPAVQSRCLRKLVIVKYSLCQVTWTFPNFIKQFLFCSWKLRFQFSKYLFQRMEEATTNRRFHCSALPTARLV